MELIAGLVLFLLIAIYFKLRDIHDTLKEVQDPASSLCAGPESSKAHVRTPPRRNISPPFHVK